METTTYNVYRITFTQQNAPEHAAIALVPAQNNDQGAGRFYHVTGDVGVGMEYDPRPGYHFSKTKSFKDQVLQFQLPKSKLKQFEEIAARHQPPHDPRALLERNPDPPVRDCSNWVEDVLSDVKTTLAIN